jgi:hypothetical protein
MEKIDPATQRPVMDADGNPVTETVEVTHSAFKVVNVFDVSQTEGREIPTIGVDELTGDVREYEMFFEALKRTCPVPMDFEQINGGAKGYYHLTEQRIAIQEGMSQLQTIKTAIHEMAHQRLHAIDPDDKTKEKPQLTRNSKEVEAESVAYTICQHYGIDTSDYSFAYIAGWSHGKETPELKASLNTIRKAASEMINEIDGHVAEIRREQAAEKPLPYREEQAAALAAEIDQFAYDTDLYEYRDTVEDRESFVAGIQQDLLSGSSSLQGMIDWFQELIDDGANEAEEAAVLLEHIKEFAGDIPSQEVTEALYQIGDEHYLDIHLTDDGSWDFTIYGKDFLEVDGGQVGVSGSMTFQEAMKDITESYHLEGEPVDIDRENFEQHRDFAYAKDLYDHGFVMNDYVIQSTVSYDLEQAGIVSSDYSEEQWKVIWEAASKELPVSCLTNPELSVPQMKYMVELIEQGYDVRSYWIAGEPHDLTEMHLSEDDITDIRYQVAVDGIPKMLYTPEQWKEIERGIRDRVDVFVYTDPQFSAEQMKILHRCLNAEALGYLDRSDVETLANPELSPEEMKEGMKELRNMHKEDQANDLGATGLQENGLYRYYSTQRPIMPGGYPNSEKPVNLVNFDTRESVADGQFQAWGYLEYEKPLTDKQRTDYELRAAPSIADRAVAPEAQAKRKKSVLADLHAKQEQVAGTKTPEPAQAKRKTKEMEQ